MMSPGQADELLKELKKMRADANQNAASLAGALAHLTQEVYLQRKVQELWLTPEKHAEFLRFASTRPPSPAPDIQMSAPARLPTQAEIDEINRALDDNNLHVGVHGLPVGRGGVGFGG